MSKKFKSLRGFYDILPENTPIWDFIESVLKNISMFFGYSPIRVPLVENTEVFIRSLGSCTDVVEKEMFTIKENSESISLRPEATAGVVRAYIEHSIFKKEKLSKFYYIGSMFRKERPQSGRNREFNQFGAEILGSDSPYADAELIILLDYIFKKLNIKKYKIHINNLGCAEDKKNISKKIKKDLAVFKDELCENCQKRLNKNVFRILDCKNKKCKDIVKKLPSFEELICRNCKSYYDNFKEILLKSGIDYIQDNSIIRGLDYYTGIVFEVVCSGLGAQNAVAAGGRYNDLIKNMGGPDIKAAGFAVGLERLIMCINNISNSIKKNDLFLISADSTARQVLFNLLNDLRKEKIKCEMDLNLSSLKSQMKQANKSHAKFAIILGEKEIKEKRISLKNMETGQQIQIDKSKALEEIRKKLKNC